MSNDTCYLERSEVRRILIGQPDESLYITEQVLADIDALPILTAADIGTPAQPSAGAPKLWQERAPNGGWFVQTEHDGHIFFGADKDSAEQCLRALSRGSAQQPLDPRIEKAVEILRRRAAGYEGPRATAIFSGRTMADELRANAREIEALADSPSLPSTDHSPPPDWKQEQAETSRLPRKPESSQ